MSSACPRCGVEREHGRCREWETKASDAQRTASALRAELAQERARAEKYERLFGMRTGEYETALAMLQAEQRDRIDLQASLSRKDAALREIADSHPGSQCDEDSWIRGARGRARDALAPAATRDYDPCSDREESDSHAQLVAALQAALTRFEDIEDDARVLLTHAPQFESMILGIRVVAQQGIDSISAHDGVAPAATSPRIIDASVAMRHLECSIRDNYVYKHAPTCLRKDEDNPPAATKSEAEQKTSEVGAHTLTAVVPIDDASLSTASSLRRIESPPRKADLSPGGGSEEPGICSMCGGDPAQFQNYHGQAVTCPSCGLWTDCDVAPRPDARAESDEYETAAKRFFDTHNFTVRVLPIERAAALASLLREFSDRGWNECKAACAEVCRSNYTPRGCEVMIWALKRPPRDPGEKR